MSLRKVRTLKEVGYSTKMIGKWHLGETTNVSNKHPDVVGELEERAAACRNEMDDERTGIEGENCRPIGRVDNPRTLTQLGAYEPYVRTIYD